MSLLTDGQRAFAAQGVPPQDLQWTGRPPSGIRFRLADWYLVPFSLLWGGFAIFWETSVVKEGAPGFFMLWGIPFVVAGIYIMIGRFFFDAYRRSKTWYGLTSDSALILLEGYRRSLQRFYLPTINSIGLDLNANGTGTITFGDATMRWLSGSGWATWSGGPISPSFEGIPDAQNVYALCSASQRRAVPTAVAVNPIS